jgi:NAD(P)H-flavin reductase
MNSAMTSAITAPRFDPWRTHAVRVAKMAIEVPGVFTCDLAIQDETMASEYRFAPGQFNMLYIPGLGEIAISICDDPQSRGSVAHTIRIAGNVTRAVSELAVGATLGLRGPFGVGWPIEACSGQDVVLVAGGIGLAPLRPVICQLMTHRKEFGEIHLIIGAREPSGLLYSAEYSAWQNGGLNVYPTVDRGDDSWHGQIGMVTAILDRLPLRRPSETIMMSCGPETMMWYAAQMVIGRGVDAKSVYVSLERNMNCAIGLCGHCQLGPQFLCKDGPVFSYDRVASIMKVEDL